MLGCTRKPTDHRIIENRATDDRVTCDQYFEHTSKVTGFTTKKPYNDAELAYCQGHTQEQLRCVLASKTIDDLNLCTIADTSQRAIAARVLPSVKKSWPGSAELMAVLQTTQGCGFGGLMATSELLTDTDVAASFSIRDATTTGDPQLVLARLRRDRDGWSCVSTDPENLCEMLDRACRKP